MISNLIEYQADGSISGLFNCMPGQAVYQTAEVGGTLLELPGDQEVDPDASYVSAGVLTARPANTATFDKTTMTADGVDKVTITNIPNPSTVYIQFANQEISYPVTTGTFIFTLNTAGTYPLRVESDFPYLNAEETINAS